MTAELKTLMTLDEVAEVFSVHRRTVASWVAEGLLPGVRMGTRTLRVHPDDVEALIESRRAAMARHPRNGGAK